ncbi:hypothetical protein CB0940_06999 [Cercospora beticola]|uniref:Uncharacterized protein n=1 Tax=Cercospora beticola TaxID=122368 RepID=A0A2G5H8F3_CERBT|nr:hypothetical protein CB0940_06999 [Cercospora beticola]PIA88807.1 hypothetical protein CB0940_06999 [Cercospora beticola]WPB02919.1 hypothetical protein RHO25_007555 [Cercospora beticola]CAK1358384.1 unnamed protein product [Cercospora beticola]
MSTTTGRTSVAISPRTALLKAYAHNIRARGPIANQLTEEIAQIGEAAFEDWYEDLEDWLENNPEEQGAPTMKLVGAWAAFKRAAEGDDKAKQTAESIWETGNRLVGGWVDSVEAWVEANPGLAPA